MQIIKAIKWYHVVIVCLFIILLFFLFTGINCTKNTCQNALSHTEDFSSAQNQSHGIPNGKVGKKDCEIILYFADWCPHCKNFMPEWDKFENYVKANMPNVKADKIKCEDGNEDICNQKGVRGFPTVMLYKDNKEMMYDGERKLESLVEYIHKNMATKTL